MPGCMLYDMVRFAVRCGRGEVSGRRWSCILGYGYGVQRGVLLCTEIFIVRPANHGSLVTSRPLEVLLL